MQAAALARQQLRVGRLAHELVPEGEPAVARIGREQLMREGFAERRRQRGGLQLHELGEQVVVDPRAGGGRGAQHGLRRRREGGDPRRQQVAHR